MTHLNGVTLLLADTVRSRAYADALAHRGFSFDLAILVRAPGEARLGQAAAISTGNTTFDRLFVPNLNNDLEQSCHAISRQVDILDTGSVNAPQVADALRRGGPSLVVFSGFGGELVHRDILYAAGSMLHLHSGWLPEFRGSTTIYYSYLAEGTVGVSALLLSEKIDAGRIVARRRYPAPPPGANVDHVYDSTIRSDLLVRTLTDYDAAARCFRNAPDIDPDKGSRTYYIIHPLLKHVALNKINDASPNAPM